MAPRHLAPTEIRSRIVRPGAWSGGLLFVVVLLAALAGGTQQAAARYAALVIDARTGTELHARHADSRRYPASLTKIMTLYMIFDAIERGELTLKTRLKVSSRAVRQPRIRLSLKTGSTITVKDAILALIVRSANDVATVVAENLAESERVFAKRMTRKAHALGMTRTTFRNASGLPNSKQRTTARDMAKLALAIQRDFAEFYHFFKVKRFRFRGRIYRNHNRLLGRYRGTDGIKTGYTNASGYNLITSVKRNGHHLIGVVFGGRTSPRRDRHMVSLINRSLKKMAVLARNTPPLPRSRPSQTELRLARAGQPADRLGIMAAKALLAFDRQDRKAGDTNAEARSGVATISRPRTDLVRHQIWGVQIGAYSSIGPARAAIATARKQVGPALYHGKTRIEQVKRGPDTIFRAQIMGLHEKEARKICTTLIAAYLPCVPVSSDVSLAVLPDR